MSDDRTRNLSDDRSFEQRMFARFDAMESRFESRFDAVDAHLDNLDTRVKALEAKALDTKPIWEHALEEIIEVKQGLAEIKTRVESIERKFDVLTLDMMQLRGDQRRMNSLFDRLESNTA